MASRSEHPAGHLADGGGRDARPDWCRKCRAPIIRGLDADYCAVVVIVDSTPLNATGEALAILADIPTYLLHLTRTNKARLDRRHWYSYRTRPAGVTTIGQRYDVVAEHRCFDVTLKPWAIPSALAPIVREVNRDEPCPF